MVAGPAGVRIARQIVWSGSTRYVGSPPPWRSVPRIRGTGHGQSGRHTRSRVRSSGSLGTRSPYVGAARQNHVHAARRPRPHVCRSDRHPVANGQDRSGRRGTGDGRRRRAGGRLARTSRVLHASGGLGVGWRGLSDLPPPAAEPTLGGERGGRRARGDQPRSAGPARRRCGPRRSPRCSGGRPRTSSGSSGPWSSRTSARAPSTRCSWTRSRRRPTCRSPWSGRPRCSRRPPARWPWPPARDGVGGLQAFGLVPGRPVRPMLAGSAPDVATALETLVAKDGAGRRRARRPQARRHPGPGAPHPRGDAGLHPQPRRRHRAAARGGRGGRRAARRHRSCSTAR